MSDLKKNLLCSLVWCIILASSAPAAPQPAVQKEEAPAAQQERAGEKKQPAAATADDGQPAFRIDQPGTITFTVGMVIKGKIEKPQVIIFLPKEKTYFRELTFTHSFAEDIARPLPFSPILE
jgi:hypothetical protein